MSDAAAAPAPGAAPAPAPALAPAPKARRPWGRWLLRQVIHGLAAAGLFFLIYHAGFKLTIIVSGSMAPTLQGESEADGDWVLAERVSFWFRKPSRWEVVAFRNQDGIEVMKRVIGFPGETVALRDGELFVDGAHLERPPSLSFLKYYPYGMLSPQKVAPCGDGYFVLGDDSRDSQDSRFEGPVPPARIWGRAWLIVRPWARCGRVHR